jgi:predicted ATP-dependent endonuclease of OLD family
MKVGPTPRKDRYKKLKFAEEQTLFRLDDVNNALDKEEENHDILVKARWVFTEAARMTRGEFKDRVEDLINLVIKSVFVDRDFEFVLDFQEKRNQVECTPLISENDELYAPIDEMGGSTAQLLGLFFRPILWSLEKEKTRPLFIIDEPEQHIGESNIDALGQVIALLSHQLGIQFILTTHNWNLAPYGDRTFWVQHDGKKSTVSLAPGSIVEEKKPKKVKRVKRVKK